jgi:hypothetical protein
VTVVVAGAVWLALAALAGVLVGRVIQLRDQQRPTDSDDTGR